MGHVSCLPFAAMLVSLISIGCGGPDTNPVPDAGPAVVVGELASRTGGVAPLAVFFDAVGTPGVMQPPEVAGRREYADLFYEWDFGDPGSGRWATDGRERNRATGYVAAHVYETPGIYTARLTATDAAGRSESHQAEITVDDPDLVYAGTSTICVSTGADFTGCPAGATQLTTAQITDIQGHIDATRRILLRRGDVWASTVGIRVSTTGPLTIGAFGTCASPDERGICANAPVIQALPNIDDNFFDLYRVTDARIMDLRMEGALDHWGAMGGGTDIRSVLALRLNTVGFFTPMGAGSWDTLGHDQYMFVDCDASASSSNILYVGSERLALLGNRLRNPADSHVLRVWQSYKGVIGHNDISGSSLSSASGRHALKFHGPMESQLTHPGVGDGLAHRSRFTVISKNIFGGSGPWPVGIGPRDGGPGWGSDERIEDILVEQNRFYPGYGDQSCCSNLVGVPLKIWARYVTVRNNIFTGEGAGRYFTAIGISQRGLEPAPLGNRILHNTIYYNWDPGGAYVDIAAFSIDTNTADTTVINNLVHFASGLTGAAMYQGQGTNLVEAGNLMATDPGLVDPDNVDFLAKDFSLTATSPALDSGVPVTVFDDFAGVRRPIGAAYDVGAFER